MARGIKFLPINIIKSESSAFVPENGAIRMPFSALAGLGENAAANIVAAREEEPFFSVEDLQIRAKLTKSVIEVLRNNKVLEGLDETDHQLLLAIIERFNGGPVGIESIASSIGEEITTIEDVYEPYLLQIGFIKRTTRGRVVTHLAYEHLKIDYQKDLFG